MNIIPIGHVAPATAVEQIGKSLFPDCWTGQEAFAREGLITVDEWRHAETTPGTGRSGSGAGGRIFAPNPDPHKKWPYGDPESAQYQEERSACLRWKEATEETRLRLEAGSLTAYRKNAEGKLHAIPKTNWAMEHAISSLFRADVCIAHFKLVATKPTGRAASPAAISRALHAAADGVKSQPELKQIVKSALAGKTVTESQWRKCWSELSADKKRAVGARRRQI